MKLKYLISLSLISIVQNSHAGFEAHVGSNNPTSAPVHSHLIDKSIYARSDALLFPVNIQFRGRCDKGYLTNFGLELGGVDYTFPGINGDNKSISGNHGESWKTHEMPGEQVLSADNPTLIQACNDYIENKLSQGFDLETLLKSDFEVSNAKTLPLRLFYTCTKKVGFSDPPQSKIVDNLSINAFCQATNYKIPIEVSDIEFRIDKQVTVGGVCKVHLKGALNTSKPNQLVRFRYEHIDKSFKKRLSQIHQVTTDQLGYASFSHQYPVSNGPGKERGKMRILGENIEFQSAQRDYSMNCNSGGVGTLQQVTNSTINLEVKPIKSSIQAFGNQLCPTKVKFVGKVKAGSDFSGQAVFIGQSLADIQIKNFSIEKGQTKRIKRIRNLDWSAPSATTFGTGGGISTPLMKQNVMQGLNIVGDNSQNVILSFPRKTFSISCSRASVQPGLQIPNGGLTTFPSHTGGGAPTDLQGNQQTAFPKIPVKPIPTKKVIRKAKKKSDTKK